MSVEFRASEMGAFRTCQGLPCRSNRVKLCVSICERREFANSEMNRIQQLRETVKTVRYVLEHLAVVFGAATGALAARGKGIDWFGVIVLGLVTSVGGGTLRDIILDVPVFWVSDHSFLISGIVTAALTIYLAQYLNPSSLPFLITDAFLLAFVTMVGTNKTYSLKHPGTICALFGVVTGVAGGMFRDVLLGEVPLVFRQHINLYATAALFGSISFLGAALVWPGHWFNMVFGALVTLLLRMAAIRWRLHLPLFQSPDEGIS